MPAIVSWLHDYDRDDGGGGGQYCVLRRYVRHDSMDILGYEDLPWILQVMFTLKRVRMVIRARKIAVTMVSGVGNDQGRFAASVVLLVVLSLCGPGEGGEGSKAPGDIERSSLRARLSVLCFSKEAGQPRILGQGVQ